MFWTKTIVVLCFATFFAQSGDMPPTPVARQTEELARKARRGGQAGSPITIPPDLFAKTETISVYPTICDAPHRACLHAYRLPYEYKGSETFAVQGRGYCYCSWRGNCRFWIYRKHQTKYEKLFEADNV